MAETILEQAARLSQKVDRSNFYAQNCINRYNGDSPLSYLSPEAQAALGDRLQRVSANFCRVAVDELAQRMRIVGVSVGGQTDANLWREWRLSGFIPESLNLTKGALIAGRSAMTVWPTKTGQVVIRPESATQTAWTLDPITGDVIEAFKRWQDPITHKVSAALYLPDVTVILSSTASVPPNSFVPPQSWQVVGSVVNPTGMPLLVPLENKLHTEDVWGTSEMMPLVAMQDLLEKFLTDAAVSSEYFARPIRTVTGLETLPTDANGNPVNPFADNLRTWVASELDVSFGQLPAGNLSAYDSLISIILQMLAGLSGLPANVLGVSADNPTSSDAIVASGLTLTSRAENRAALHDAGWSRAIALQVALQNGGDPRQIDAMVIRSDPRYSSEAAEADAVSKLVASGILSRSAALRRLGYSPEDIQQIEADSAREAVLRQLTAPTAPAATPQVAP